MIESSEWDVFDSIGKKTPKPEGRTANLEELAQRHLEISRQLEALSIELGQVENEIAHVFPEEAGEKAISTNTYEVVVRRTERWSWDKKALEDTFSQGELPPYVKRSMTIDKRQFQKLPSAEQESLKHALTRTLDKPKIQVIPHV